MAPVPNCNHCYIRKVSQTIRIEKRERERQSERKIYQIIALYVVPSLIKKDFP